MAVWLASDGARFITGQSILVDGGYTIGGLRWQRGDRPRTARFASGQSMRYVLPFVWRSLREPGSGEGMYGAWFSLLWFLLYPDPPAERKTLQRTIEMGRSYVCNTYYYVQILSINLALSCLETSY